MARFIIYIRNLQYRPKDIDYIIRKSRHLCLATNIAVRDVRISNNFIELDIYTNIVDQSSFKIFSKLGIVEQIQQLDNDDDVMHLNKTTIINKGVWHFNTERFWECHEILEDLWKNCTGIEKDTLQGIILTAAALVHYQKNESRICISMLNRAKEKLLNSNKFYHQINLTDLKNNITKIVNSNTIKLFTI